MVNWVPIVVAAEAALPAAGIFFAAYGRYDGAFKDNVVFLYFIGGLVLGGLLGFLTLLLYGTNATIAQVVGVALLYPIAIVAAINRRKWQGQRHAVFNGGAAGLGAAVMLSFSLLYIVIQRRMAFAQEAANQALRAATGNATAVAPPVGGTTFAFDPVLLGQGILLGGALSALLFGLGLLAGDGVRRRKQLLVALTGTAILIAPSVFLLGFFKDRTWLWLVLLLTYAVVFAVAAERRLLPLGVEDDVRRQRRRKQRSESNE